MKARTGHRHYWVPSTCRQLRQVLREMDVTRISGRPLSRVRKAQLMAVYLAMRDKREHNVHTS